MKGCPPPFARACAAGMLVSEMDEIDFGILAVTVAFLYFENFFTDFINFDQLVISVYLNAKCNTTKFSPAFSEFFKTKYFPFIFWSNLRLLSNPNWLFLTHFLINKRLSFFRNHFFFFRKPNKFAGDRIKKPCNGTVLFIFLIQAEKISENAIKIGYLKIISGCNSAGDVGIIKKRKKRIKKKRKENCRPERRLVYNSRSNSLIGKRKKWWLISNYFNNNACKYHIFMFINESENMALFRVIERGKNIFLSFKRTYEITFILKYIKFAGRY